ncbi:hypothetical protein LGN12_24625 [Burkholderia multivorans]|nr:hypothetical protein [Burkholderia multivorans]
MIFDSVLLPAPFSPVSASASPGTSASVTSASTGSAYVLPTPETDSTGAAGREEDWKVGSIAILVAAARMRRAGVTLTTASACSGRDRAHTG